ncbi:MAG: METTL5 family protein [Nanoarchaeota archaeon]
MVLTKKELAVLLSSLKPFPDVKVELEQYQTPGEIAADVLWTAHMQGDLQGKIVADLGCGTGILGCGALALGAKHVLFVDVDRKALLIAKENVAQLEQLLKKTFSALFMLQNVAQFHRSIDTVLQNPPFGVQEEHADRAFLQAAMASKVVYSFHKLETRHFIENFVRNNHKTATFVKSYTFPLKKTMLFHTKPVYHIDVGLWRIQ